VECAITVLRELPEVVFPATKEEEVPPPTPSSDLHKHLGELLESQKGADVTFLLPLDVAAAKEKTITLSVI